MALAAGQAGRCSVLDSLEPFDVLAPHQPLLLDEELQPKPAYHPVRDLVATHPD